MLKEPFNIKTEIMIPLQNGITIFNLNALDTLNQLESLPQLDIGLKKSKDLYQKFQSACYFSGLHQLSWNFINFLTASNAVGSFMIEEKRQSYKIHTPEAVNARDQQELMSYFKDKDPYEFRKVLVNGMKYSQISMANSYSQPGIDSKRKKDLATVCRAQGLTTDLIQSAYDQKLISPSDEASNVINCAVAFNNQIRLAESSKNSAGFAITTYMKDVTNHYFANNDLSSIKGPIKVAPNIHVLTVMQEANNLWRDQKNKDLFARVFYN